MAVSISRNLSVTVTDNIADKLTERRQWLKESFRKDESKVLGVSQVMAGLMVCSYSIPLLSTNFTEVLTFGVPWWSGVMFIVAGAVAIEMEKRASWKFLCICLKVTFLATLTSVFALIFYCIDFYNNPETSCNDTPSDSHCDEQYYSLVFSRGVKSSLLIFTVTQTFLSSILGFTLYKHRRNFNRYASLNVDSVSTCTDALVPDLN